MKEFESGFKDLADDTFLLEIDGICAMCIIASIQLATRHPKYKGPLSRVAIDFARKLQTEIPKRHPMTIAVLEMGWDPNFDIE